MLCVVPKCLQVRVKWFCTIYVRGPPNTSLGVMQWKHSSLLFSMLSGTAPSLLQWDWPIQSTLRSWLKPIKSVIHPLIISMLWVRGRHRGGRFSFSRAVLAGRSQGLLPQQQSNLALDPAYLHSYQTRRMAGPVCSPWRLVEFIWGGAERLHSKPL